MSKSWCHSLPSLDLFNTALIPPPSLLNVNVRRWEKPGDILHTFQAPFTRDFLLAQYGPAIFDRQVVNLTGRFNVINFAGLFSGTAVAPPRSVSARLRATF